MESKVGGMTNLIGLTGENIGKKERKKEAKK
jgi:hypothetical protein